MNEKEAIEEFEKQNLDYEIKKKKRHKKEAIITDHNGTTYRRQLSGQLVRKRPKQPRAKGRKLLIKYFKKLAGTKKRIQLP